MHLGEGRPNRNPFEVKIVIKTNPYAMNIRKGDTTLNAALDKRIGANLTDGKLSNIYNSVAVPEQMPTR